MKADRWLEKAHRCLEGAKILIELGDADGACSRSYYAMFNAARAAVLAVGQDERSKSKTHSGLISAFGQYVVNGGHLSAELSRVFGRESNRRLLADYESEDLTIDNGNESIANAEIFLEAISTWIQTLPADS